MAAALATLLFATCPVAARPLPPPPARDVLVCPFPAPDDVTAPLLVQQEDDGDDSSDDPSGDGSDDDDEGDDDAGDGSGDDGGSDGPSGFVAAQGCVKMGLTLDAGVTVGRVVLPRLKGLGRLQGVTTYTPKSTFDLWHTMPSDWGDVTTRLELETVPGSSDLSRASIQVGAVIAGVETSFFDAWSADEFSFRALASSQSPTLLGVVGRPSDRATLSMSLEDTTFRRVAVFGYAGQAMPDVVGRLRYYTAPVDLTFSAALRETRLTLPGASTIHGVAALASARITVPTAQDGSYVIVQGAWADQAPGYLGVSTRTSVFAIPLGNVLDAAVAEKGRGWNAALVGNWQWAETWASAAFVSYVSLDIPGTAGTGRLKSTRGAANVTWQASQTFTMTAEVGAARFDSGIPLVPSSRSYQVILSMSQAF
ncbi:porin [Alsobacter sp. R-9]